MKISGWLKIAGVLVWLIMPWLFTVNPAEPALFQWGLCIVREQGECLRSIYWLDFFLLGSGLIAGGFWLGRRKR